MGSNPIGPAINMPNLKQTEKDEISSLLSKIEEPEIADRLNDWEENFLSSVSDQFSRTEWLSEKQIDRLRKIVEGDNGTSEKGRGSTFGRPGFSYRDPETTRPRGGGFAGFARKSAEDQPDDIDD